MKTDAERYYAELKERLRKFNLELEESKSRLIEFGRFAESKSRRKYGKKPETFDFLGFTFYCGKGRKSGNFCVKLKTSRKNSKLYSLVEFKDEKGVSIRKDAKFNKQYLEGRYGVFMIRIVFRRKILTGYRNEQRY